MTLSLWCQVWSIQWSSQPTRFYHIQRFEYETEKVDGVVGGLWCDHLEPSKKVLYVGIQSQPKSG